MDSVALQLSVKHAKRSSISFVLLPNRLRLIDDTLAHLRCPRLLDPYPPINALSLRLIQASDILLSVCWLSWIPLVVVYRGKQYHEV